MQINPQAPVSPKTAQEKRLLSTCKKFEGVFLNVMFQAMRPKTQDQPGQSLFDSGFESDIYNSMLYEEIAKTAAKGKGLGLADAMYRQLVPRLQKSSALEKGSDTVAKPSATRGKTLAAYSRNYPLEPMNKTRSL